MDIEQFLTPVLSAPNWNKLNKNINLAAHQCELLWSHVWSTAQVCRGLQWEAQPLHPAALVKLSAPRMTNSSSYQDINYPPKQPGALPISLRQAQAVGPSMDAGFQISSIFSNKFVGEEGKSSLVIGKDLWDSPCTCGRSCHMQYSSKCPRAAAHTGWTPHLPQVLHLPHLLPMWF